MLHKITLPKAGTAVEFRAPTVQDKRTTIRDLSQDEDFRKKGYNLEEGIAVRCIEKVDGEPAPHLSDMLADPYALVDTWQLYDQLYFMEVFFAMFFPDEKGKQAAQDEAKKMLGALNAKSSA